MGHYWGFIYFSIGAHCADLNIPSFVCVVAWASWPLGIVVFPRYLFSNCTSAHDTLRIGMGGNRGRSNKAKPRHHVSSRTSPPHNISAATLEGVQAHYVKCNHRLAANYGQE